MNATANGNTKAALPAPKRSRAQKAAAVLALLENDTLQQLAGKLPDRHRDRLLDAVKSLRRVDISEQKRIAQEFARELARGRNAVRGNDVTAERLKEALFQEEEELDFGDGEGGMLDFGLPLDLDIDLSGDGDEDGDGAAGGSVWQRVEGMPVASIAKFFGGKSSSVLSVAMSCLPDDFVSEMMTELDEAAVKGAMVHLATNGKPNPFAISAVEALLEEELFSDDAALAADGEGNANTDRVAAFLNRMVSSRRDAVLEALDAELSEEDAKLIRSKVLSFTALGERLVRSAIPLVLREIDEKTLLVALQYGNKSDKTVVDYLLANISQRMAAQYREKMEALGDVDEETGETAQSQFLCMVLGLADDGKIDLLTPSED